MPFNFISLLIVWPEIFEISQPCNLAHIQSELAQIRLLTIEGLGLASQDPGILMTTLLIEQVMVYDLCSPFLSIFIPGFVSFTALLLFLYLNPLQHLYSANQADRLVE